MPNYFDPQKTAGSLANSFHCGSVLPSLLRWPSLTQQCYQIITLTLTLTVARNLQFPSDLQLTVARNLQLPSDLQLTVARNLQFPSDLQLTVARNLQ